MSDLSPVPIAVDAKIKATARGSDTGMIVASATGLGLVGIAAALATTGAAAQFKLLIYGVGGVGLVIALAGILGWFKSRRSRTAIDAPMTQIIVAADNVTVTSSRIDQRLMRVVVGIMAGRKALPAPHGRVDDATGGLKAYTEDQKRKYLEEQLKMEANHDAEVFEVIRRRSTKSVESSDPAAPKPPRELGSIGPDDESNSGR
jgi:hypothetical protein